jgi:hypothetical protein
MSVRAVFSRVALIFRSTRERITGRLSVRRPVSCIRSMVVLSAPLNPEIVGFNNSQCWGYFGTKQTNRERSVCHFCSIDDRRSPSGYCVLVQHVCSWMGQVIIRFKRKERVIRDTGNLSTQDDHICIVIHRDTARIDTRTTAIY